MNRRHLLKSVASTTLLPTIPVLDISEGVNYEYLDSLFSNEYMIAKNPNGTLGKTYSATYEEAKNKYTVQYRAYSQSNNVVDVYDNSVAGCIYKHYRYLPQNPYEAFTVLKIGRKQGLESLLSTLDRLELDFEGKVTV
jgi:hypothetical protein